MAALGSGLGGWRLAAPSAAPNAASDHLLRRWRMPAGLAPAAAGRRQAAGGRSLGVRVAAGERPDPSQSSGYRRSGGNSDPNYRRQNANDYWRKRENDRKSSRGSSVSADNEKRRRGRPAHMRSPDDTPLRDGNRDRLMGLLTDRAARTLESSVQEDNPALQSWLRLYLGENNIPKDGNWSDVSGENFLRTLLTKPVEEISGSFSDEEPQFAISSPVGGDPRALAQRIMELRHAIALEWIEDLQRVPEENKLLVTEMLMKSLEPAAGSEASSPANGGSAANGGSSTEGQQGKKIDIEALDDSAGGGDD